MRFTKLHGAGNDYVYIDCFTQPMPHDPAGLSRRISDRHFGIGSDGLILICPSDKADARMRMFNADGSESEMCGNGIRCVAKFVYDHGLVRKPVLNIETGRLILKLELEIAGGVVKQVCVDMGEPILDPAKIPTTFSGERVVNTSFLIPDDVRCPGLMHEGGLHARITCISMGNPHEV